MAATSNSNTRTSRVWLPSRFTRDRLSNPACSRVSSNKPGYRQTSLGSFYERDYRYTIILQPEPDEGGFSVTVPALPGCVAQGETLEEAIALAREAIALHVRGLVEEGEPVPEESEPLQALSIRVAA
jgi:predicted RNase H-like HicB family nuclease